MKKGQKREFLLFLVCNGWESDIVAYATVILLPMVAVILSHSDSVIARDGAVILSHSDSVILFACYFNARSAYHVRRTYHARSAYHSPSGE